MTNNQFQKVITQIDSDLKQFSYEIAYRGEDLFDPFLFAKALTLKLRVAFQLIGQRLLEVQRDEHPSDLYYQNEDWMAQMNWADQGENCATS